MKNELETFIEVWDREAPKTRALLESLPAGQYDFRPDPEGRSLAEMAWHVAEPEGWGSAAIEHGGFARDNRPAGMDRPKSFAEMPGAYDRLHRDALERLRKIKPEDLDRTITFFNGTQIPIRNVLWDFMLLHAIHHRGQLALMIRESGARPAIMYGGVRETMPLRRS